MFRRFLHLFVSPKHNTPTYTFNKNKKQFDVDYDDSSDEEEVNEQINEYSIEDNWRSIQKDLNLPANKNLSNDKFLSFIAHAAGVNILYSKQVNQIYYPQKHRLLHMYQNKTGYEQLTNLSKQAIERTTDEVIKNLMLFSERCKNNAPIPEQTYNTIRTKFLENVKSLVEKFLPDLMKCIGHNKYSATIADSKNLDAFINNIHEILTKICLQEIKIENKKSDIDIIKNTLFKLCNDKIHSIFVELKIDKNKNSTGKEHAQAALARYDGTYKNLSEYCQTLLNKSSNSGYVYSGLLKLFEDDSIKFTLIHTYLDDLATDKNKLSNDELKAYSEYYSFCLTNVEDEISASSKYLLKANMVNSLKNFYRPTLPPQHNFVSNQPFSFYANIRLSNRSQQRTIANLQSSIYSQQDVMRAWRLAEKFDATVDVVEQQSILENSFGRRDLVLNVGNYKKIYEAISKLKNYMVEQKQNITDKDIAQWIRDIFTNKTPPFQSSSVTDVKINHYLHTVTYLLFGCEASRNPGMIVINQMLLDLIINNPNWTFEEVFTGKKDGKSLSSNVNLMPMAPEGAVAAARTLNEKYKEYMPYAYTYPGTEDKDGNDGKLSYDLLCTYEAKIFRAWLNDCCNKPIPKANPSLGLLKIIESHMPEWFFAAQYNAPTFSLVRKKI